MLHDNVIKWRHFPRYWPFMLGIHRPPVNSPHNGQWRGALMFSLICAWIDVCLTFILQLLIVVKFCTEDGSITAVLCAQFWNEWSTETGIRERWVSYVYPILHKAPDLMWERANWIPHGGFATEYSNLKCRTRNWNNLLWFMMKSISN